MLFSKSWAYTNLCLCIHKGASSFHQVQGRSSLHKKNSRSFWVYTYNFCQGRAWQKGTEILCLCRAFANNRNHAKAFPPSAEAVHQSSRNNNLPSLPRCTSGFVDCLRYGHGHQYEGKNRRFLPCRFQRPIPIVVIDFGKLFA